MITRWPCDPCWRAPRKGPWCSVTYRSAAKSSDMCLSSSLFSCTQHALSCTQECLNICEWPTGFVQDEKPVTLGSGTSCQLRLSGGKVAEEHAKITPKGGQVFCRALTGDPDNLRSDTNVWILPDTQLRAGVDYALSPGAQVYFSSNRPS